MINRNSQQKPTPKSTLKYLNIAFFNFGLFLESKEQFFYNEVRNTNEKCNVDVRTTFKKKVNFTAPDNNENKNLDWKAIRFGIFARTAANPFFLGVETIRTIKAINLGDKRIASKPHQLSVKFWFKAISNGWLEQSLKVAIRESYRLPVFALSSKYDLGFGNFVQTSLTASLVAIGDGISNPTGNYITDFRSRALDSGKNFAVKDLCFQHWLKNVTKVFPLAFCHSFSFWLTCFGMTKLSQDHPLFNEQTTQKVFSISTSSAATVLAANGWENAMKIILTGNKQYSSSLAETYFLFQKHGLKLVLRGSPWYFVQTLGISTILNYVTNKNSDTSNEIER